MFRSQGSSKFRFFFRPVDYPGPPNCNSNNQYNPDTFNWNNTTAGAFMLHDARTLGASSFWSNSNSVVPPPGPGNGFAVFEAIDVRVHLYAIKRGSTFVDDMEVR